MRILKLAVISFILFFLLFTAISLLFPSHIRISRAINIGAPTSSILDGVRDTQNWHQWHPAFENSAAVSKKPGVRFVQNTDSLVVAEMTNNGKKKLINGWQVYQHQGTDSITLQWYIDFHLQWYPWQKFGSLFYENTYGAMMQDGLLKLKTQTENTVSNQPVN